MPQHLVVLNGQERAAGGEGHEAGHQRVRVDAEVLSRRIAPQLPAHSPTRPEADAKERDEQQESWVAEVGEQPEPHAVDRALAAELAVLARSVVRLVRLAESREADTGQR